MAPRGTNCVFFRPQLFQCEYRALADRGIFLGTSSWKYEGWLGQIYTPERYEYRAKVAKTPFEEYCLDIIGTVSGWSPYSLHASSSISR